MNGQALRVAREQADWTQARLAKALGVTQAYVSLMESGERSVPDRLVRTVARVLGLPPTMLPVGASMAGGKSTGEELADELASLGYPGFAYRRTTRPTRNPAELLLSALMMDDLDARLAEALPWLLLQFEGLDLELVLTRARAHDLQNRLGFTLALAREVAEHNRAYRHRLRELRGLEERLERSRLAREDTFGQSGMTERMRTWLRDNRSDAAKHWNLLTDLKEEHLPYASRDRGSMAQLPA